MTAGFVFYLYDEVYRRLEIFYDNFVAFDYYYIIYNFSFHNFVAFG